MDKASNKFSFYCKKCYNQKIRNDTVFNVTPNVTYEFFSKSITFQIKFGLKLDERGKSQLIMNWMSNVMLHVVLLLQKIALQALF